MAITTTAATSITLSPPVEGGGSGIVLPGPSGTEPGVSVHSYASPGAALGGVGTPEVKTSYSYDAGTIQVGDVLRFSMLIYNTGAGGDPYADILFASQRVGMIDYTGAGPPAANSWTYLWGEAFATNVAGSTVSWQSYAVRSFSQAYNLIGDSPPPATETVGAGTNSFNTTGDPFTISWRLGALTTNNGILLLGATLGLIRGA